MKENVPAGWYDRVLHTRDVRDKIAKNHGQRSSVLGIGYQAGKTGGENPSIVIDFNKESEDKKREG